MAENKCTVGDRRANTRNQVKHVFLQVHHRLSESGSHALHGCALGFCYRTIHLSKWFVQAQPIRAAKLSVTVTAECRATLSLGLVAQQAWSV